MIKSDKPDFFDTYEKTVRPDLIPAEPTDTPPADDLFKVEDTPPETAQTAPPETAQTAPTLDDAALEKIAELVAAKIAPQTGGEQ